MGEYPYINTVGRLREFVSKIPDWGVPESVTTKWLPTVGFGSTNHRPIIRILRFIGFIEGNRPTQRWLAYRDNSQSQRVMAECLWSGYSDLFKMYPDAQLRTDDELKNYFKGKTTAGDQVVSSTVNTFKALCSFADFSKVENTSDRASGGKPESSDTLANHNIQGVHNEPNIPLHIDVQIHISADTSNEQIDLIFSSMAKHLYNIRTLEKGIEDENQT